jgi:hypothetical protein
LLYVFTSWLSVGTTVRQLSGYSSDCRQCYTRPQPVCSLGQVPLKPCRPRLEWNCMKLHSFRSERAHLLQRSSGADPVSAPRQPATGRLEQNLLLTHYFQVLAEYSELGTLLSTSQGWAAAAQPPHTKQMGELCSAVSAQANVFNQCSPVQTGSWELEHDLHACAEMLSHHPVACWAFCMSSNGSREGPACMGDPKLRHIQGLHGADGRP